MDLFFLGTGAGMPTKRRNVTSVALRFAENGGGFWLFDCGEGTQHQMLRSPLKLNKLEKLFVTHLHGDHIYGIPGLLTSRSYSGGETPLDIYGPPGIRNLLETVLQLSQARLSYALAITEFGEGIVAEDARFRVRARKLEHRIDSYGFRVEEKPKPGRLLADKLAAMGVRPGPVYGRLKRGEDVVLEDGRAIRAADVVGESVPGRIVTILGDTRPCGNAVELAERADVVVHEATFAGERADLAKKYYHSTAAQAAETAAKSGARALVLTHFSSRYQEGDEDRLLAEAKAVFANTCLARDLWAFPVNR